MADKQVNALTSSTPTIDDLTISYDNADTSELKKTTWQAVRDLFKTYFDTVYASLSGGTFTGDISVPDEAYGVGWNGSLEVPTKNAVYDKIETMGGGGSVATDSIWDAKGDLAVGTGANTASRLAVGANGTILIADSAEATGVKWGTVAGSGDVVGPASSTDNAIARFDSTTGKVIQNSGATLDDNSNIYSNNYFPNATSTVSSAGTTVLTVASARIQRITGSTTHTFQLPNATTLPVTSIFEFDNGSSGSVTINNAGGVAQYTLTSGGDILIKCTNNGTSNGVWDIHALAPSIVSWSSGISGLQMNNALSTTPLIQSGASSATAPSFIPQRGSSTTGFGGDGTNLSGTIAGTEVLKISSTGITTTGNIELGHASDTTITRESAGQIAVEGVRARLKNPIVLSATSYTTDTGTSLNMDNLDMFVVTAQAGALLFNAPGGTLAQGRQLIIRIKDNGTSRALTYNAIYRAIGVTLPTATTISKTTYMGFVYNSTDTKWDCIAVATEA